MENQTQSAPPIVSHDLLAALDNAFGLEQLEDRWKPYGYTVATAMKAKVAYEEWAKEDLHFDCLDNAILGTNESGGLFPTRLEAFFAGWISSANAERIHGGAGLSNQPETSTPLDGASC